MKIKLKLLSDSIPGVGQEIGGLVDIDVNLDKNGLPVIPGKRIKGLFKENAENLRDAGLLNHCIEQIFGKSGDKKSDFKISNGYLLNYITFDQFLNYIKILRDKTITDIFNPMAVIDFFTYKRTQTAVNYEKGVAKEQSLRIARVLRKGLEFHFDIECNPDHEDDIKRIYQVSRNFGTSRTRGFGHIKFESLETNSIDLKSKGNSSKLKKIKEELNKNVNSSTSYQLSLELKNQEQILVSNEAGNKDSTNFYIPGSTVFGTFARKYIDDNSNVQFIKAHRNEGFYNLFLSNHVYFTNFYPKHEEIVFYPHPYSINRKKNCDEYYDLTVEKPGNVQMLKMHGFSTILPKSEMDENLYLQVPSLSKHIEYHHARPPDRSIGRATARVGEFFQYEVLQPNHHFHGAIIGPASELIKVLDLFESDEIEIDIGKSRSAQYGKSILKIIELKNLTSEKGFQDDDTQILITFRSDMILRNENGLIIPDPSIFLREFALALGISETEINQKIKIEKSYLKQKIIGGYSTTWKLPKIQAYALGAGSELLINFSTTEPINWNNVQGKFFGERTSEGYGEIRINRTKFSGKITKKELHVAEIDKPSNLHILDTFVERIMKEIMKRKVRREAHLKAKALLKKNLSKSFIQRIKLFVETSDTFEDLTKILSWEEIPQDIPKDFKEKLDKISSFIFYNLIANNFEEFIEKASKISQIDTLKDIDINFTNRVKLKLEDKTFLYKLYQEYCKTLLKDVQQLS